MRPFIAEDIEAQLDICEQFFAKVSVGVPVTLCRYIDIELGYGGSALDRPGLQRLLCDAKELKVDSLFVDRMDRLAANAQEYATVSQFLDYYVVPTFAIVDTIRQYPS